MDEVIISGIQQIGIGVTDVQAAFKWYRRTFGMDIPAFDDSGEAVYMAQYTGGKPQSRRALLALNLQGGSGLEIWQFTERKPETPSFQVAIGDLGIFLVRIKSRDVEKTYRRLNSQGVEFVSDICENPASEKHFFLQDPFGNIFQIIEDNEWFARKGNDTGGACGCLIGVTDIDRARSLYTDVLGYDRVLYDEQGIFQDFAKLPSGREEMRRVLLAPSEQRTGSFSRLIGPSRIELVQSISRRPAKIFAGRYWGDQGFIHLCFDVYCMEALREKCKESGFKFTVDSSESFYMGDAAGHFSYIEDVDGTLIEFVETHRLPVMKKLGIYLNLRNRDPKKPLPDWMIKMLSFSRVKD